MAELEPTRSATPGDSTDMVAELVADEALDAAKCCATARTAAELAAAAPAATSAVEVESEAVPVAAAELVARSAAGWTTTTGDMVKPSPVADRTRMTCSPAERVIMAVT